jgi:hypothetical protein
MSKETEIMAYLQERVFGPVLESATASAGLKSGVRLTVARMEKLPAASMLRYYWSAVQGTDKSNDFARKMRAEGFMRFEEVLEDFRERFNDRWLEA